jgi:aspartate-semialdehyde dehydrogenase
VKKPRYVIVGGATPLGADVRETLLRHDANASVRLLGSEDVESTILTVADGEAAVISGLRADELESCDVVFLTGSAESSRRAEAILEKIKTPPLLIDLTRASEAPGKTELRAPSAEPKPRAVGRRARVAIAHPVAIALAAIVRRLHSRQKVKRAVASAYIPASEWGREGIDELHKQTLNLLAFHRLPQAIFDTQLAFNLLARYGAEAPVTLESIGARVAEDFESLAALTPKIPVPAMRILQASCMHGIGISLWVEFAEKCTEAGVTEIFQGGFDVRDATVESPHPVGMAAQDGIGIGAIERDRSNEKACWIFAAADNYRLMSQEAAAVVRLAKLGGAAA